ncbi:MAG: Uma2 family endonuclease [Chloroflexi bacterium]|nr:Uma2 family endonuclease [Chloroflexota bacterium]
MAVQLQRRAFTVDDYHKMVEAGILTEDDRVELICGEIIEMAPIGSRHAACVKGLNHLFATQLGGRVVIGIQDPIQASEHSEPQPDVSILRPRSDRYVSAHPTPADIFLLLEVSDSTLAYDRDIKLLLYARASVPEVWLLDLAARRVEAYRSPSPNGYLEIRHAYSGDALTPAAFPEVSFAIDDMLV